MEKCKLKIVNFQFAFYNFQFRQQFFVKTRLSMSGALSPSEVDSLLAAFDPAVVGPAVHAAKSPSGASHLRSGRFSSEQLLEFQSVQLAFGREFGRGLSQLARADVAVKLISVDQLSYGEFVAGLEQPTCFNLIKAVPQGVPLALELSHSMIFPLLDRLLGGGAMVDSPPRRSLTEIEARVVTRITSLAVAAWEKAWSGSGEFKLTLESSTSHPRSGPIVPEHEAVLFASFEIQLGDFQGILNLCLPESSDAALRGCTNQKANLTTGQTHRADRTGSEVTEGAKSQELAELVVRLTGARLTEGELRNLAVGDTIVTDKHCAEPLEVCVNGLPRFLGFGGILKGQKAVRINVNAHSGVAND
jgi:flagellar motor switch protein FliM